MASYQPPIDTTAIFNSQSFSASNYTGESDPNKLDFPNAQGVPTMSAVNVSDGINSSLITPTGITNSGAYSFNTSSIKPITTTNTNIVLSNSSAITSGTNNIAIGQNALSATTSGVQNVAIGIGALQTFTASNATAVGYACLQTTTANNTGIGSIAGNKLTSGGSNCVMGFSAFTNATTSSNNIAIGVSSGAGVTTTAHTSCCFLGSNSDTNNLAGHSNSVALGTNSVITGSNQIMLGQASIPSGVILPSRQTLGVATLINSTTSTTTFPSFTISTINNGTAGAAGTIMTTFGQPPLLIGMFISVAATPTFCVAGFSGVTITGYSSPNTWTISSAQTVLVNGTTGISATYNLLAYPLTITSITSNVMTIPTSVYSPTLPAGTIILGAGIASGVTVSSGSGTSYTLSATPNIGAITGAYNSPTTMLDFPLSELYYIVPQTTAIAIRLPNIASINVGAKVTFRIVSSGLGSVSLTSSANNIFTGTNATPSSAPLNTGSHTIYPATSITFASTSTTASIVATTLTLATTPPTLTLGTLITGGGIAANTFITAILTATTYTVSVSQTVTPTGYILPNLSSHTFMCLPTSMGAVGFGWFQLGSV